MAEWIDYGVIKQIPIRAVLHRYGIQMNGKSIACPLPTHTSKKKETSFSVKENFWVCWSPSCQANRENKKGGDVIHFVMAKEGVDRATAGKMLAEWFAVPSSKPLTGVEKHNETAPKREEPQSSNSLTNKPLGFYLKEVNPSHPMIQGRGITEETAADWKVGFYCSKQKTASMDNRIVFPIHVGGTVLGYIGRATEENQEPRWLLGKNITTRDFLYGLERCDPAKQLVLVESAWTVLWMWQRKVQAAALLGSVMTDAQFACLEPFRTIHLMLDDDEAGRAATEKLVERLKPGRKLILARWKG